MVSKGEWNKAIKEMYVIHRLEEQNLGLIGFGKIAQN
jgi:phosphoglycerate dehydrogenase-like enzyme